MYVHWLPKVKHVSPKTAQMKKHQIAHEAKKLKNVELMSTENARH